MTNYLLAIIVVAGRGDRNIATPDSRVQVLVIHTQEDWQIAKACWAALESSVRR